MADINPNDWAIPNVASEAQLIVDTARTAINATRMLRSVSMASNNNNNFVIGLSRRALLGQSLFAEGSAQLDLRTPANMEKFVIAYALFLSETSGGSDVSDLNNSSDYFNTMVTYFGDPGRRDGGPIEQLRQRLQQQQPPQQNSYQSAQGYQQPRTQAQPYQSSNQNGGASSLFGGSDAQYKAQPQSKSAYASAPATPAPAKVAQPVASKATYVDVTSQLFGGMDVHGEWLVDDVPERSSFTLREFTAAMRGATDVLPEDAVRLYERAPSRKNNMVHTKASTFESLLLEVKLYAGHSFNAKDIVTATIHGHKHLLIKSSSAMINTLLTLRTAYFSNGMRGPLEVREIDGRYYRLTETFNIATNEAHLILDDAYTNDVGMNEMAFIEHFKVKETKTVDDVVNVIFEKGDDVSVSDDIGACADVTVCLDDVNTLSLDRPTDGSVDFTLELLDALDSGEIKTLSDLANRIDTETALAAVLVNTWMSTVARNLVSQVLGIQSTVMDEAFSSDWDAMIPHIERRSKTVREAWANVVQPAILEMLKANLTLNDDVITLTSNDTNVFAKFSLEELGHSTSELSSIVYNNSKCSMICLAVITADDTVPFDYGNNITIQTTDGFGITCMIGVGDKSIVNTRISRI